MRIITASVIIAALSLGMTAFVQAQGASPQPRAQEPPAQSDTVIRSIQVVDIKQLQPAVRSKVDEIVAQTSEEDLQSLRKSIDAAPAAVSALKAKGLELVAGCCHQHRRRCAHDVRQDGLKREVLVKAPPWTVTTPSLTVPCSAYMIGLSIYGIKRSRV
ncbi:hypothetical protein [Bradyrhizobium sp. LM2.3]